MTREEAIEVLCKLPIGLMDLSYEQKSDLTEALNIAIAALRGPTREQVERVRGEWKECFEDWRMQIAGDQCSRCGFQHYGTSINYYKFCPTCGAPMTDEAVDIVMKRLEALKDETKAD